MIGNELEPCFEFMVQRLAWTLAPCISCHIWFTIGPSVNNVRSTSHKHIDVFRQAAATEDTSSSSCTVKATLLSSCAVLMVTLRDVYYFGDPTCTLTFESGGVNLPLFQQILACTGVEYAINCRTLDCYLRGVRPTPQLKLVLATGPRS